MQNKFLKLTLILSIFMLFTVSLYAKPSMIPKPLDMASMMLKCFTKMGLVTQIIFGGGVAFMIIIKALPFLGIALGGKTKKNSNKKDVKAVQSAKTKEVEKFDFKNSTDDEYAKYQDSLY